MEFTSVIITGLMLLLSGHRTICSPNNWIPQTTALASSGGAKSQPQYPQQNTQTQQKYQPPFLLPNGVPFVPQNPYPQPPYPAPLPPPYVMQPISPPLYGMQPPLPYGYPQLPLPYGPPVVRPPYAMGYQPNAQLVAQPDLSCPVQRCQNINGKVTCSIVETVWKVRNAFQLSCPACYVCNRFTGRCEIDPLCRQGIPPDYPVWKTA